MDADAGKSTTGGQILFLSGQVDDRTIQKYEKEAKDKSRESWYALIVPHDLLCLFVTEVVLFCSFSTYYILVHVTKSATIIYICPIFVYSTCCVLLTMT